VLQSTFNEALSTSGVFSTLRRNIELALENETFIKSLARKFIEKALSLHPTSH